MLNANVNHMMNIRTYVSVNFNRFHVYEELN